MTRGALAAGTIRTYVLHDRITRASCFVCANAGEAVALARWIDAELPAMRDVARVVERPVALDAREAARREDARRRTDVPRALAVDDRRRGRAEHDDPQLVRAEHGLRDGARTAQARARRARGEHGRRQEAVRRVLPVGPRQDRARGGVPLRRADQARAPHDRGRPGGALLGGHARRGRERDAVGRVHAGVGDRSDLHGDGPGHRHGRDELDGARHGRRVDGGLQATIRFGGLEVGTVGGGTTLPSARDWLASIDCAGPGKVYRFAQIVAAAALCLEISASAAMATAGSENFFKAHHERGGLR